MYPRMGRSLCTSLLRLLFPRFLSSFDGLVRTTWTLTLGTFSIRHVHIHVRNSCSTHHNTIMDVGALSGHFPHRRKLHYWAKSEFRSSPFPIRRMPHYLLVLLFTDPPKLTGHFTILQFCNCLLGDFATAQTLDTSRRLIQERDFQIHTNKLGKHKGRSTDKEQSGFVRRHVRSYESGRGCRSLSRR